MRVSVTLVDPRWDVREDVVLDADDATPVGAVVDELLAVLASPALDQADVIPLAGRAAAARDTPSPTLYHRGELLDPALPLAESGLKEGSLLARRQEVLSMGGHADLSEQRASAAQDERLPHVLFLLDRWEGGFWAASPSSTAGPLWSRSRHCCAKAPRPASTS